MKLSQKRAIWYKERDRRRKSMNAFLSDNGKLEAFRGSHYKTEGGYIRGIASAAFCRGDIALYRDCMDALKGDYGRK